MTRREKIEHWQEIGTQAMVGCMVGFVACATFVMLALFLDPVFQYPGWIALGSQLLAFGVLIHAVRQKHKIMKRKKAGT